mgnify:CR=1 FL=1
MRLSIANRINISFGWETWLTLLLCTVWASMMWVYADGVFNRLPVINLFSDWMTASLFVLPALLSLPAMMRRLCLIDYLFYFVNVLIYMGCYVFFPKNTPYLNEYAFTSLACVYTYYFIGRVMDIDRLFTLFTYLSAICILADLFFYLVYMPGHKNMATEANEDNMYAAYQALPHVAFMLWATAERFRIWKLAMGFLGVLFLLSCGTRGPLVCIAFFGIIYFFFYMNFKGAVYIKSLLVAAGIILLANLRSIAIYLAQTFTGLNLSTRIMEKIVMGDLGNDSQRGALRERVYEVLANGDHFWGLGLFGCRNYGVIYPHFLPLDFFCTYGYFMGSILLALLVLLIVGALWLSRGKKAQQFIVFLFSVSVIKLLMSNSFIIEPYFFFLVGFCAREVLLWNNARKSAQIPPVTEPAIS